MSEPVEACGFTLSEWQHHYQTRPAGERLACVSATIETLVAGLNPDDNAWLYLATSAQREQQYRQLAQRLEAVAGDLSRLPLFGVPFAIKDNIDVGGWPTSAACPAFTYQAAADATVVAHLRAAGAIALGKTNLDQFATGLVGTRSPYGAVVNSFDSRYVSGGSSSGSASVVARGLVPFALGTDTAGSGRVPAGFNNIVGLKPTKGRLSNRGVVPACRLNDTVSVFALTVADAAQVAELASGFDEADPYSRPDPHTAPADIPAAPRFAVPAQLEFFGDVQAERAFHRALAQLQAGGATLEPSISRRFAPWRNSCITGLGWRSARWPLSRCWKRARRPSIRWCAALLVTASATAPATPTRRNTCAPSWRGRSPSGWRRSTRWWCRPRPLSAP